MVIFTVFTVFTIIVSHKTHLCSPKWQTFFFSFKKNNSCLKKLECNSTPLPHLVYAVLSICKLATPPLTHTSSEIHFLTITLVTRLSPETPGISKRVFETIEKTLTNGVICLKSY